MATTRPESLDAEPAVKATSANRHLMQKNMRASDNWFKAKRALDREQRQYESKVNIDKNALLKQRDRLQSISLTLDTVHESETPSTVSSTPRAQVNPESGFTKRRMTLADVYDSLIRSVREQNSGGGDNRSVYSEPNLTKSSTASFDSKKVKRKPVKFSLQSLQRAQSNLQEKLEALNQTPDNDETNSESEPTSPPGYFDLSEAERKLGPKLHLPPTTLPPIRSQTVFKPRSRSFDRPIGPTTAQEDFGDLQYCRYIRGAVRGGRRNSAPAVRHVKRSVQKIQ